MGTSDQRLSIRSAARRRIKPLKWCAHDLKPTALRPMVNHSGGIDAKSSLHAGGPSSKYARIDARGEAVDVCASSRAPAAPP